MKKKLLLCLSAAFLMLLTACGIEMDTRLSVNEDFKGSRIIACSLKKNDIKAFQKNLKSLDAIIEKNCPKAMTYTNSSDEEQFYYTFKISFSSLKDYKKKVNECLNFAADIDFAYSNSPFSKGLLYKENFTSQDLMAWFSESLVEADVVNESESKSIWSIKDTSFVFNGKSHIMDNKITIDTMEYLPLDGLDIYTEEKENGSLKRTIQFRIPKESLDKRSKAIERYLKDDLDSSYECRWHSLTSGKSYSVTYFADTMQELERKTRLVLKEDGKASCTILMDDAAPLQFKKCYNETYSLNAFRSSATGEVSHKFYFKPASHSSLPDFKEKTEDGYYLIHTGNLDNLHIAFNEIHRPVFASYQLTTIYHSANHMQRELWLDHTSVLSQKERTLLKKSCMKYGFSSVKQMDADTLLFLVEGSPSHVSSAFDQLLQTKNAIKLTTKKHTFSKSRSTEIDDTVDLSHISWKKGMSGTYYFVSNSDESIKNMTFSSESEASHITRQNTLEKSSVYDSSQLSEFKGAYRAKISGPRIYASYSGGITDVYGSILIGIAFFVILTGVVIMILYRYRKQIQLLLKRGS